MQFVKTHLKCQDCIKPLSRRLGLFQVTDEYECYADSYVKCFWSLCDHQHKSLENLVAPSDGKVITAQPQLVSKHPKDIIKAPTKDMCIF